MSDHQTTQSGDLRTHLPLPYLVRLRVSADEDAAPDVRELHLMAYSVIEALLQASMLSVGPTGADQIRVEFIGPDPVAYARLYGDALVAASLLRGPK